MTIRLNLPFPSKESLREVWDTQLRSGQLFIPTSAQVAVGDDVVLSISAPAAPSPLDLLGTVIEHREVADMVGLQVRFELGDRETGAIDAYAAGYWQEAFVLLGVSVDTLAARDEPEPLPHGYADRPTPVQLTDTDEYARPGREQAVTVADDEVTERRGPAKTITASYQWPPPEGALDEALDEAMDDPPSEPHVEVVPAEVDPSDAPPVRGAMITKKRKRRPTPRAEPASSAKLESAFIEIISAHAKMEAREELHRDAQGESSGATTVRPDRSTPPPARGTGPRRTHTPRDSGSNRTTPTSPPSRPLHGSTAYRTTPGGTRHGAPDPRDSRPNRGAPPSRPSGPHRDRTADTPTAEGRTGKAPPPAPSRAALRNLRESGGKKGHTSDRRRRKKSDS